MRAAGAGERHAVRRIVTPIIVTVAVLLVVAFFAWANRSTRAEHAAFTRADVESALLNFVAAKDGDYYDEWDLFLAWPIADPTLEEVRQRCLRAIDGNFENHSAEAQRQVEQILGELRESA